MRTRAEVAEFINKQMNHHSMVEYAEWVELFTHKTGWHYGTLELRQLMDFLYDGPPTNKDEYIE